MKIKVKMFVLLGFLSITLNSFATTYSKHQKFKQQPFISNVSFESADPEFPNVISGQLRVPKSAVNQKVPAIVVVHGSAGIDSRGQFYIRRFNAAGFATLEIDMWAPRGWLGGVTGRPRGVPETVPDAYGALSYLSTLPNIDADKIAIIGFSWGGVVTMLSATEPYANLWGNGRRFAAHVAHYPVCWGYNIIPGYEFAELTGAPVLIQAGELDNYDQPESCPNLVASLSQESQQFVQVKVYRNATHAWDRLEPERTVFDPFACLGAGCEVTFTANPRRAKQALRKATRFFKQTLRME